MLLATFTAVNGSDVDLNRFLFFLRGEERPTQLNSLINIQIYLKLLFDALTFLYEIVTECIK